MCRPSLFVQGCTMSTTLTRRRSNGLDDLTSLASGSLADRVHLLERLLGEPACRQLGIIPLPEGFNLSVVIPVYNERAWIAELVSRVQAVPIPKEIILVDDCSTDGTRDILKKLERDNVRVIYQPHN